MIAWMGSIVLHLLGVAIFLITTLAAAPEPLEEPEPIPVTVVTEASLEQAVRRAAIADAPPAPAVVPDAEEAQIVGEPEQAEPPPPPPAAEDALLEAAEAIPAEPAVAPPPEPAPPVEPEIETAEPVTPEPEPAPEPAETDPSPQQAPTPPAPPIARPERPEIARQQEQETPDLLGDILSGLRSNAPGRPAPRAGGAADGPELTGGEKNALVGCIEADWTWDPGVPFPETLEVILLVTLNRDAQVIRVEPANQGYLRDRFYRSAFERARRAVYSCDFAAVTDPAKFESWREMRLRFDPSGIFN